MRRMIRFSPVRLGALVVAVFAMVLAAGASAATPVTIGQTSSAAAYLCSGEIDLQTGVASGQGFVVPGAQSIITSWSTFAGAGGGSMSMMVFRPTTVPGTYTVVAESPVESLNPGVLDTFPANVLVQGGDLLGFWSTDNAACITHTGAPGDINPYGGAATQPTVGTTVTPTVYPGYLLNISATLLAKADCMNGGWKTFGVFKNQGDCVSFVATGGKNQPALG
jgi:hypothetical protein